MSCAGIAPPVAPATNVTANVVRQPGTPSARTANASERARPEPSYRYDDAERDSDEDGIVDPQDRCPSEPGYPPPNGDGHGCPKMTREPEGPNIGMMVRFEPGSANLERAQNYQGLSELAEAIVSHEMCGLVQSLTLTENAEELSDSMRNLGRARAEATRRLLLKKGLPAARIRMAPNTYPRELLEQGGSPDRYRDTVVLYPRPPSECELP